MTNYTEALVNAMSAHGSFTYEQAVAFAEANGLKPRSVISKIKSMGLPYTPKPVNVTKRGEPVVSKGEIVASIEAKLQAQLPSLLKMSKEDLVTLSAVIAA
jgi:hypothetical protein